VRPVFGFAALALVLTTAGGCSISANVKVMGNGPTTTFDSVPARLQYVHAQQQWRAGALAFSSEQSTYFRRAAADLTRAIGDEVSDAGAYRRAVAQLRRLASLPETSDTPAQIAEAKRDLAALNRFFATKNLYD
jgi:hypothetical protein